MLQNLKVTNSPDKVDRAALKTQTLPVHGQGRQGSLSKSQSSRTKSELQFGLKKMLGQPSERHVKVTFISFSFTQVYQPHPQHTTFTECQVGTTGAWVGEVTDPVGQ